jgi:siroheme decarboxylase
MDLTAADRALLGEIQHGLPLESRPFAAIGARLGLDESDVLTRLRNFLNNGIIKRLGVIVRHHELGYRANAMTVWDIPDEQVQQVAARMLCNPAVTLCYRRPRRQPDWPYNLFCMIHGRRREDVLIQIDELKDNCSLHDFRHDVLFSMRRFKQCGAHYPLTPSSAATQITQASVAHG